MRKLKPILWAILNTLVVVSYGASIVDNVDPNAIVGSDEHIASLSQQELTRFRRSAGYTRGSHRGQTQSQYLNFGDTDSEGKAEAEATSHGSRAVVAGSNGMGQAQSQSSGGDCGDCSDSGNSDGHYGYGPDPLTSPGRLTDLKPGGGVEQVDAFGRPIGSGSGSTAGTGSGPYPGYTTGSGGGGFPITKPGSYGQLNGATGPGGSSPGSAGYTNGGQNGVGQPGAGSRVEQVDAFGRPIGSGAGSTTGAGTGPYPGYTTGSGGGNLPITKPGSYNQLNGATGPGGSSPGSTGYTNGGQNGVGQPGRVDAFGRPIGPSSGSTTGSGAYPGYTTGTGSESFPKPGSIQSGTVGPDGRPTNGHSTGPGSSYTNGHGTGPGSSYTNGRQNGGGGAGSQAPGSVVPGSQSTGGSGGSTIPGAGGSTIPGAGGNTIPGAGGSTYPVGQGNAYPVGQGNGLPLGQGNTYPGGQGSTGGQPVIGGGQNGFGGSSQPRVDGGQSNISGGKQPGSDLGAPLKLTDSRTIPATDIYAGLREILKLPQGFCLVKCDTIKPGQTSFSPDDAYALANKYPLDGPTGGSGYPGGSSGSQTPGAGLPGSQSTGEGGTYPSGQGSYPGGQGSYPGGQGGSGGSTYPGGQGNTYPGGQGSTFPGGQGSTFPGGQGSIYPGGQGSTYPGSGTGAGSATGAGGQFYPGAPANLQLPGAEGDDSFSQAETSVKNGEAVASAQGTKNGGTAQTQVQGTYSGSGSFSANAQTSDKDRSAQAQVAGTADGALSSAQGTGGAGKSQSQVEVNAKTGGTSASSQSGGVQHQSQSEVQANEKGGLADAQSSGPGQTSSQAQIGFRPEGEALDEQNNIFNGGGQASAQSGAYSGQSQSQINGNFKYGISYHGAAQSASGTKEQVASYREQNKKLFQSIGQFARSNRNIGDENLTQQPSRIHSDIADVNDLRLRTSKQTSVTSFNGPPSTETDQFEYDDDEDEYDDEDYDSSEKVNGDLESRSSKLDKDDKPKKEIKLEPIKEVTASTVSTTLKPSKNHNINTSENSKTFSQNSPTQKQQAAVVVPSIKYRLTQTQNGKTQVSPPPTTTEKVPEEKKYHTRFLPSKHITHNVADKETNPKNTPDTYVTVTKSVSGSLDNNKTPPEDNKEFASTYYTKSSTCGYFTFSCNIVYGSNGRSKICRPKAPSNGKC